MAQRNELYKRPISTLLSITLDTIAKNLRSIQTDNLQFLPPHCKDVLLKKITTHPRYVRNIPGKSLTHFLRLLAHQRLHAINLNNFAELVTDECLQVLEACPRLQEIRLSDSDCFTAEALQKLLLDKQSLKIFICSNCAGCNDRVLIESITHCTNLEYLDVRGCEVSNKGLISIAGSLQFLKWLTVSNTKVTGPGVLLAVRRGIDKLIELRVDNCEEVTAEVLEEVFKKCNNLKIVSANNCSANGQGLDNHGTNLQQINWTISW